MKYPLYLFLTLAALSLPAAAQDGTMPFRARLSTAVLDSFRYSDQGIAFPIWDEATDASASAEGFSVELEDLAATPAATVRLTATGAYGRGAEADLPLTPEPATWRLAVGSGKASLFRADTLYSTLPLQQLALPAVPSLRDEADTPATSATPGSGIYDARNLVPNPGFETEGTLLADDGTTYKFWPVEWQLSGANATEAQAMGVRCNKADPLYANGREGESALMFRQDGAGGFSASAGSYVYARLTAPLRPGRRYVLAFQALAHTNDLGKTYAAGIGPQPGRWEYLRGEWTAPAAAQTLREYRFEFTAPASVGSESYVGFLCSGSSGIVHLDRVTLVEAEGDYNLLSLTTLPGGTPAEVRGGRVGYDPMPFSPVRQATNRLYDGGEYRFYHTHYTRLLGQKDDPFLPGLSAPGTNDSLTYVFTAEATADGYYRLRQKSSGRYLASSGNYSMTLAASASEAGDRAEWTIGEGAGGWLRNHHNGLYLGCDEGADAQTYISVYSDKAQGPLSTWQLTEAAFPLAEAREALYKQPLAALIGEARTLLADPAYAETAKAPLRTATEAAQSTYDQPETDETALTSACTDLRAALEACRTANNEALSSGTGFPEGETFTLALGGVQLASDEMAGGLEVRNSLGRTTRFTFSRSTLQIDGIEVCDSLPLGSDGPCDLRFAFAPGRVTVYAGTEEMGTAALAPAAGGTSGSAERGWTLIGKAAFASLLPETVSTSAAVAPGTETPGPGGRSERHAAFVRGLRLTLDSPVDFHISRETTPLEKATFYVLDDNAWIIFDNTLPSDVIASCLGSIRIKGQTARNGVNCRVAIYLNGAAVIPHSAASYKPFEGFSEPLYGGTASEYAVGKHNLGTKANSFRSFILRRGYMACVSSDADGKGYSRVFVADHEDLCLPQLPEALDGRISCVQVKRWNYVSKKGWCSTHGNSAIAEECRKMRATWYYTWSADRTNTDNTEYVPIKQHLYWPSWSQINALSGSTHVLSLNEPEHSEQHDASKCDCGGTIDPWKACTLTPDFLESGMRIGSPAPTDMQWLYDYVGHVDDMAYRCDYVVIHAYWGTNEMADARAWYNQLKTIYDKTKRPIWITEWNNGASWTTESWPSGYGEKLEKNRAAIASILEVLDTCRFVERYSIYNWDSYYRAVINPDDGWITPAGEVYRDSRPTFAYNAAVQYIPHWWKPSVKDVSLSLSTDEEKQEVTFSFGNPNLDLTDSLMLQYRPEGSTGWQTLYTEPGRSRYDTETFSLTLPYAEAGSGQTAYRLKVSTQGTDRYSSEAECTLPVRYPDGLAEIKAAGLRVEPGRIALPEGRRYSCRILTPAGLTVESLPQAEGSIPTAHLPAGTYLLQIEGAGTLRFAVP